MPTIEQARTWYADRDPVHGFDHVLRVLALAERLARQEGADMDVVRAAALLHDAEDRSGTIEADSHPDHQHASASFARQVLIAEGWPDERAAAVEHCIRAHRFRDTRVQPGTLEAAVLYDADKLDAIGAIGVARAIAYAVKSGSPIYAQPSARFLATGEKEPGEVHSAYHEYLFKLRKIKDGLYTNHARALAEARHRLMEAYFNRLAAEISGQQ